MAHDLIRGRTHANFAISGHPPIDSYQWDFVRGVPRTTSRKTGSQSKTASSSGAEVKISPPKMTSKDKVSETDFDAAKRWMANISENVKYTRKVHGDKFLSQQDEEMWGAFWRKWLMFGNRLHGTMKNKSLMTRLLETTSPVYQLSRLLIDGLDVGMMSEENKREFDALMHESVGLYNRFRLLGMSQVALPYMGELVVMIRNMPPALSLSDMAARLRATAKAGTRMLDEHTAWWQWKTRSDASDLVKAIKETEVLAVALEKVSKTKPGEGLREKDTPVYQRFMRTLSLVYMEAARLYGVVETQETARAELFDDIKQIPKKAAKSMFWLVFVAGVGYLGIRWLTRPKIVVIENPPHDEHEPKPYHPGTPASHSGEHQYENVDSGHGQSENEEKRREYQEVNPDIEEDVDEQEEVT